MPNQTEAAPVRGLLLIGIALLIGVLFLSKGFDSGGVTISAGDLPTSETTVPSGIGSGTDTTDSTEVIPGAGTGTTVVPPDTLLVYVANGAGVPGAAGVTTTQLQNAGYTAALPPGDAPTATTTLVYYFDDGTTNYQADAQAVATVIGAQPTAVQPLPLDPGFDIGNAVVVVVLGPDLAQPAA